MSEQDQKNGDDTNVGTGDATGAGNGDAGQDSGEVTFSEAQQAKLDQVIGDRLKRAKEKWQAEAETAKTKAAEEAEAKRLEEQQEFQKLAEQRAAKVTELEGTIEEIKPLQEELKRYKDALAEHAKTAREGLPEHLTPLLDTLDPVAQLEYLTTNAEALGQPKKGGPPPTPKGQDGELDQGARRKRAVRTARF